MHLPLKQKNGFEPHIFITQLLHPKQYGLYFWPLKERKVKIQVFTKSKISGGIRFYDEHYQEQCLTVSAFLQYFKDLKWPIIVMLDDN